ncbi:hypothetical protein [Micromonospora sp. NPDC005197]|uniref:hypothetical protein n=1 Tax=unclassified Micromonospora TaxID=2617518 RepID=UPI0033AB8987
MLFDLARPDAVGRVTARPLLRALGWTSGLALHVDVVHAAVLITPTPDGAHVVGAGRKSGDPSPRSRCDQCL